MMAKVALDRAVSLFFVVRTRTVLLPERRSHRTIADHDYLRGHIRNNGLLVRVGVVPQQTNLSQDIYARRCTRILKITAINCVTVIGYKACGRTDVSKPRA